MRTRAIGLSWLAVVCLTLLNGCGGSNPSNSLSSTGRTTGHATFKVIWPKPTRPDPHLAANSIVVQILSGTSVVAEARPSAVPRPEAPRPRHSIHVG